MTNASWTISAENERLSFFMAAFNPLDYPACLSSPARLTLQSDDPFSLPFMMFLVELLRPQVFVELGTKDGASYCACCQVIKTLGLSARCYGISADEPLDNSREQVFAELKHYHDPLYQEFSKLNRSTYDQALMDFEDDAIDLLHLRAEGAYETVRHLYQAWLPKMSARGAIIFHKINESEHGSGMGRLWNEIKSSHAHFELPSEKGLGIISARESESSALLPLWQMSETDASRLTLFFQELGRRLNEDLKREQQIKSLILEAAEKDRKLQKLSAELAESRKTLDELTQEWQTTYKTILRKWAANQKEIVEDRARAIQSLSDTLTEERERLSREREQGRQLLAELQATSVELVATRSRLDSILGSRAWRWVTRYGKVKAVILSPLNKLFSQKVDSPSKSPQKINR